MTEIPLAGHDVAEPVRILAIVVLYHVSPAECRTLKSLMVSLARVPPQQLHLKVLLYDNTEGGHEPGSLPECVRYYGAPHNDGVAVSYNIALDMAEAEGYEWLLTLDQDSVVPESFLDRVSLIARELKRDKTVAAIAPMVSDHGAVIAPQIVFRAGTKKLPKGFVGIPSQEIVLINSGTTWRVDAVRAMGGFNPLFWLDYLDYWISNMLYRAGKRIYVAGDVSLEHELSLTDPKARMSPARFENYLLAQSAFYDLCRGRLDGFSLTKQLFLDCCRQQVRGGDATFRRLTWQCVRRRITQTRDARLKRWRQQMSIHLSADSRQR